MKLFVTGGTGFIGSHFLRTATAAGFQLHALRRTPLSKQIGADPLIRWFEGDLATVPSEALNDIDAFVHFAAAGVSPQEATWDELFKVNVISSVQLWNRAADAGVTRFVICGSCFEYGASAEHFAFIPPNAPLLPTGGYAASKAAATMAALGFSRERNVKLSVLRPFHLYGEGQHPSNLWPSLRDAALAGLDFDLSPGRQIRSFCPVENAVRQFVDVVSDGDVPAGIPEIRNVGSCQPIEVREFAKTWWKFWNAKGSLRIGTLPYRRGEVMRYVPLIAGNCVASD